MARKIPLWKRRDLVFERLQGRKIMLDLAVSKEARDAILAEIEVLEAELEMANMLEIIGEKQVGAFIRDNLDVGELRRRQADERRFLDGRKSDSPEGDGGAKPEAVDEPDRGRAGGDA